MPGTDGNIGKLAAFDVNSMNETWAIQQTSAVSDRGAFYGRRGGVCRRPRSRASKPSTCGPGKVLWQTRLATSVQGFPISFSVDGKQYVAVSTGLGGGSPRLVPATLAPEIRVPTTGQALYVFALPDRK